MSRMLDVRHNNWIASINKDNGKSMIYFKSESGAIVPATKKDPYTVMSTDPAKALEELKEFASFMEEEMKGGK